MISPDSGSLANPGLEADEFLLALGCRADQHQHAFGILFHSGLQVDPIGPHVHVSPRREVALLPSVIIRLPLRGEPGDHRRRQVRCVLAQQGSERILEVADRYHHAGTEPATAHRDFVRRAHFGRIDEVKRIFPPCPRRHGRAPWRDGLRQIRHRSGSCDADHGRDRHVPRGRGHPAISSISSTWQQGIGFRAPTPGQVFGGAHDKRQADIASDRLSQA